MTTKTNTTTTKTTTTKATKSAPKTTTTNAKPKAIATKTMKKVAEKKTYNVQHDLETPNEMVQRVWGCTARELAKDLRVDLATLYGWINRGELFTFEPETAAIAA
jgi:hypothetical protein